MTTKPASQNETRRLNVMTEIVQRHTKRIASPLVHVSLVSVESRRTRLMENALCIAFSQNLFKAIVPGGGHRTSTNGARLCAKRQPQRFAQRRPVPNRICAAATVSGLV